MNSAYSRLATRGAAVDSFVQLAEGTAKLTRALRAEDGPRYVFLYWDAIDRVGHECGPASPAFAAEARAALDVLDTVCGSLADATVLLTADHGQVEVSPDRVDHLDELWPELPSLLAQPRPAGSSRDAFLHVRPGHADAVIAGLADRLGDRARVLPAAALFDEIGPRLRERLGQVAVLPAPGRQVWMRSAAANERWYRGQHGGLDPAETATYLAEVAQPGTTQPPTGDTHHDVESEHLAFYVDTREEVEPVPPLEVGSASPRAGPRSWLLDRGRLRAGIERQASGCSRRRDEVVT